MRSLACAAEELLSGVNCDDLRSRQVWKHSPLVLLPVSSGIVLCPPDLGIHYPFRSSKLDLGIGAQNYIACLVV